MHIYLLTLLVLMFCQLGQVQAAERPEPTGDMLELNEVVVTATKTPHTLKDVPIDTIVITANDIARSNAQNLVEVLGQVPGIITDVHDDIFGTYTWRASMQGLSFNDGYALILVDGQRMIGAGQSGGMGEYGIGLNQIPLSMIKRIEIVQGPGTALYGSDAVTGVINIITKGPSRHPTASAGASYGWYNVKSRHKNGITIRPSDKDHYRNTSSAYVSLGDTPFDRLGYCLDYGYEKAEDIRQNPVDSYRHTVLGKLDFNLHQGLDLDLSSLLSHYEKTGYRQEDTWRIDAKMKFIPRDGQRIRLMGYMYKWEFDHGYPGYAYGYKHGNQKNRQVEMQYDLAVADLQHLTVGGEYREQLLDYVIEGSSSNFIPVRKGIYVSSLYLQDEMGPFNKLTVVPGVRYDHHSVFGDELNPKLSLKLQASPGTTLRASAGRAFKSPTIRQLYYQAPYEHGSYFIMSNPDLNPEISWGYSASLEHRLLDDRVSLWISGFRNDIRDLVQRVDTNEDYQGKPLMTYKNVNSARTQGIECMIKARLAHLVRVSIDYTYTDSEDRDTHKELTYVPQHYLALNTSYYHPAFGAGISTNLHYTGKQYTNSKNTKAISDHAVVGLRLYKDLMNQRAKISLEADNIFGSSKGDRENFRMNRMYLVRLDLMI